MGWWSNVSSVFNCSVLQICLVYISLEPRWMSINSVLKFFGMLIRIWSTYTQVSGAQPEAHKKTEVTFLSSDLSVFSPILSNSWDFLSVLWPKNCSLLQLCPLWRQTLEGQSYKKATVCVAVFTVATAPSNNSERSSMSTGSWRFPLPLQLLPLHNWELRCEGREK